MFRSTDHTVLASKEILTARSEQLAAKCNPTAGSSTMIPSHLPQQLSSVDSSPSNAQAYVLSKYYNLSLLVTSTGHSKLNLYSLKAKPIRYLPHLNAVALINWMLDNL